MESVDEVIPVAQMWEERRHLTDAAYQMLGSRPEAEYVVDEVYRCWYGLPERERAQVVQPRSWLVGSTSRICRARLAAPQGGKSGTSAEPAQPDEREHTDRARHSLRARHARPAAQQHDAVAGAVRDACRAEAPEALEALLAPDVSVLFDGGGKVRAPARPIHGFRQVAWCLLSLLARHPRTTLDTHSINGRTGLVVRYDRQVAAVLTLDVADARVVQVWVTLNPDKLRSWNRPA
ncbi:RNA polymerase subunit sigma [Streptomyces sp. NPDC000888]